MIGGAVIGAGGAALGRHAADVKGLNEETRPGSSRGLMSEGIQEQVAELTELAEASGHKAPLRHVHASPPPGTVWGDDEWDAYWSLYERAQGLEGCPYSEAVHVKPGEHGRPEHSHRVYLAITTRGTLVRSGHDYARQEAVSRIVEYDTGAPFVKGAHNIRAAHVARRLGREDVAKAMQAAGLLDGLRARAGLAPGARAQQERTNVGKADVAARVAQAWRASDSPQAFMAALRDAGMALARGDKGGVPVILDATGATHGLRQMLGMAARAEGSPAPKAAAIAARLDGAVLPSIQEARHAVSVHVPVPPDERPRTPDAPTPPGDGKAEPGGENISHTPAPMSHGGDAQRFAAAEVAPGALLEDAGPGPGEPPGPGAHPDEIARYGAALAAREDRKAAAWARFVAAQGRQGGGAAASAQSAGGQDHGLVQHQAAIHTHAGGAFAAAAAGGARPASPEPRDAGAPGDDGAGHRDGPATGPDHRGHAQAGGPGGEPARGGAAAGRGGEHDVDGHREAAGGHRLAPGEPGQQAFRHGVQAARAARGLAGLNTEALLDRVIPERAAMRLVEAAQARLDARRARAPHPDPAARDPNAEERRVRRDAYAPLHAAQQALRAALDRQRQAQPVPGGHRWLPWTTAQEAGHQALALAVATTHADIAVATPSPGQVADAVHLARMHAENRRDEHQAWLRTEGRQLDREQHLLDGVWTAVHRRDPTTLHAIASSGLGAAMRLQAEREDAMDGDNGNTDGMASVVAFHHPGNR